MKPSASGETISHTYGPISWGTNKSLDFTLFRAFIKLAQRSFEQKKTCILCIIPTFLILTIRFSNKPSLGNEMTYTVSSGALNSAPTKSLGNDKVSVTAFRFQSATRAGACADRQTDGLIIRCWQVRGLCLPLIGYEMPGPDVPQCHYRSLTNNNNAFFHFRPVLPARDRRCVVTLPWPWRTRVVPSPTWSETHTSDVDESSSRHVLNLNVDNRLPLRISLPSSFLFFSFSAGLFLFIGLVFVVSVHFCRPC